MNRTFIFILPKDIKAAMSFEDFIKMATLRVVSIIFFKGEEDTAKEVEITKFAKLQEHICGVVIEKEFEIMSDGCFKIIFDIDESLFI